MCLTTADEDDTAQVIRTAAARVQAADSLRKRIEQLPAGGPGATGRRFFHAVFSWLLRIARRTR